MRRSNWKQRFEMAQRRPDPEPMPVSAKATTWWGRRWIEDLEECGIAYASRLAEGRAAARSGQVSVPHIEGPMIIASVQDARPAPFEVHILLDLVQKVEWEPILKAPRNRYPTTCVPQKPRRSGS